MIITANSESHQMISFYYNSSLTFFTLCFFDLRFLVKQQLHKKKFFLVVISLLD